VTVAQIAMDLVDRDKNMDRPLSWFGDATRSRSADSSLEAFNTAGGPVPVWHVNVSRSVLRKEGFWMAGLWGLCRNGLT
jgi:hypothetical protein